MQITDDLGREIALDSPPQRIISLVPSLTELLFDLGLGNRVVGVTKFCIHPTNPLRLKEKIGGTKNFNFGKIKLLNPDLIIANKEENYKEGVEKLMKEYSVYVSDIFTLDDALRNILNIGKLTWTQESAIKLSQSIHSQFVQLKNKFQGRVLYFIWQSPWLVAGKDNFIDYMLVWLGIENAAGNITRYPELNEEALKLLNPEHIFLSSEPFPFREKHLDAYQKLFPNAKVHLVDGEMFSWYGSRLQLAAAYFKNLLIE